MDDDLTRDIGAPLAGDDDDLPVKDDEEANDDLDDNFDRELREAERELEETDQMKQKDRKGNSQPEKNK